MSKVHLSHWWVSASELQSLDIVRQSLEASGLSLVDDPTAADVHAILMSAYELWERVRGDGARPVELSQYLPLFDLESRIFPPFRVADGPSHLCLYGIPLGAFRNNTMWVHRQIADEIGGRPRDIEEWTDWLTRASKIADHPLGVSREPWAQSLLFESVLLSMHGPDFHRRAFGLRSAATAASAQMLESIEALARFKPFVSPPRASQAWHQLAAEQRDGRVASLVMGDWLHNEFAEASTFGSTGYRSSYKWTVPGTEGIYLYNVDYITLVEHPNKPIEGAVLTALASTLLHPQTQCKFGLIKGALPAIRDAIEPNIDPEGWKLFHLASLCPEILLPSLSLLQGNSMRLRDEIAGAVRGLLFHDASVKATHAAIVEALGRDAGRAVHLRLAEQVHRRVRSTAGPDLRIVST
jgi:glucose/mannose transport system substrate-binding protein